MFSDYRLKSTVTASVSTQNVSIPPRMTTAVTTILVDQNGLTHTDHK